jgi:putative SOS response-associated peptidase YedK
MCGRYSQSKAPERVRERFGIVGPIPPEFAARYNIAPSQDAPVIVLLEDVRLELFRWGLIPSWAKDPSIGNRLINARAETLAEKPSFRKPFKRTRCLVAADGFYEWKVNPDGKTKTPMRVRLKADEPFAMAGLWDHWTGPDGKEVKSFTIVTTAASESIAQIHDRMPVILKREDEAGWLDPETKPEALAGMLKPYPPDAIESYAITKIVNSPGNDSRDCFRPA